MTAASLESHEIPGGQPHELPAAQRKQGCAVAASASDCISSSQEALRSEGEEPFPKLALASSIICHPALFAEFA